MPCERPQRPAACEATLAASTGYLRGSSAHDPSVREHLRGCAGCRESLALDWGRAGGEAQGVHAQRRRAERDARRTRQRGLALAGAFQGWSGGPRGARLRLLLVPAFAIVLMTHMARGPAVAGDVRVRAVSGVVWLDEQHLGADTAPRAMLRGEGCATGSDGSARLESTAASVELAPGAQAWLESRTPARFRLGEGRFTLRGDLTATTRWGVLECVAVHAEVRVASDGLALEILAGSARCFDSRGERTLSAGERVRLP